MIYYNSKSLSGQKSKIVRSNTTLHFSRALVIQFLL